MRLQKFINEGHKAIRLNSKTESKKVYEIITLLFKDCKQYLKDLKGTSEPLYRGARGGDITLITPRADREPKDMSRELQELFDTAFYNDFGWYPRSEGVFCSGKYDQASGYGSAVFTVWPIGKYNFIYSDDTHDLYTKSENLNDKVKYGEDSWYDDFEEEYEDEYGEDGDYGSWYYNGTDTNETVKSHAIDVVADWEREKQEFETEEEEENFDPFDYISEDDLDWVPEEEKEDWINNKIEDRKEDIEIEVKDMVSDFADDNIQNAIDSHNEVMLSCESYYLINNNFTDDIFDQIKLGPPSKQKQLKFQFAYKKRRR
jgi:hypothetical protein